jgi:hypothetical protein
VPRVRPPAQTAEPISVTLDRVSGTYTHHDLAVAVAVAVAVQADTFDQTYRQHRP